MYPVEQTGSAVRLRELGPADVDAVHAIYGDTTATEHLSFEPRSREHVETLVARLSGDAQADPRSEYSLAVVRLDDESVVGLARLATESEHSATVGLAVRADAWRQGFGAEAARLLLALGFGNLNLYRIWAACSPANQATRAGLLKLGFTEEGRIRAHVHVHGAWRDSVTYSILRPEWESA